MTYRRLLPTAIAALVIVAALAATPAAAQPSFTIFELCDLGETHYRVNPGPWQECPVFDVVAGVETAPEPYLGEGMYTNLHDEEQMLTPVVAAASVAPTEVYLPCQAGEGLVGPRGSSDPCMVVAAAQTGPVLAYYVCEAGEGLIGPRAQTNYCRQVAAATADPEPYYPCDVDALRSFFNADVPC